MHYTVYKTTNKINGKYYIGKHKTDNLNDGYLGSGKLLKRAISKYGIENFTKEILHVFDNEQDMNLKEAELVVVSEETYNLCEGGKGGFGYINLIGHNNNLPLERTDQHKKNLSTSCKKAWQKRSDEVKQKSINNLTYTHKNLSENHKKNIGKANQGRIPWNKGKKHSEETKRKISESRIVSLKP